MQQLKNLKSFYPKNKSLGEKNSTRRNLNQEKARKKIWFHFFYLKKQETYLMEEI